MVVLLILGTIDERNRANSGPIGGAGQFLAVRFELVRVSLLESSPFGRVMAEPFAQRSRGRAFLPPLIDTRI